jgi:hypothetical protein
MKSTKNQTKTATPVATQTPAAPAVKKPVAKAAAAAPVAPVATKPVVAPLAENETPHTHRRFTSDAVVKEWRVVRSQRKEFDGYFVQGGEYRPGNRGSEFHVAREFRYATNQEAKAALATLNRPQTKAA